MGLDWVITKEVYVGNIRGKYVLAQLECCDLIDEVLRDRLYEDTIEHDNIVSLIGCIEKLIDEMRSQTPLAKQMDKEDDMSWDAFFEEEIEYFEEVCEQLRSVTDQETDYSEHFVLKASY